MALIWMPQIGQVALNRLAGAHLRYRLRSGRPVSPLAASRLEAGAEADADDQLAQVFRAARDVALARFGKASASDLINAWRKLEPTQYAQETALRLLPLGVWQNDAGRDIFANLAERLPQPDTGP